MKIQFTHGAASALLLAFVPAHVDAFWRMGCSKIMDGRIDPVVFPGIVSPHTHTIVGGSNIGINSTYKSMIDSACTSCEIQADKSAYWAPLLYFQYANGSFIDVYHGGSVIYYLGRGPNVGSTIPFPEGFKMFTGNASARAFNTNSYTWGNNTYPPRLIAEATNFACLPAGDPLPEENSLNSTAWKPFDCVNGLRAQAHFPTCWNGVDLYLSDGSHVAHLNQIDNGICPPTYPYQLPHIFIETLYSIDSIPGNTTGGRFVFANGDPTGYGYHADFLNGWNQTVQALAMANCLAGADDQGLISNCPSLQQSDTSGYSENCPTKKSPIAETVLGLLPKLPGCVEVTDDPSGASYNSSFCPSSVAPPNVTPTADSVAQYTVEPAVGTFYPAGTQQEYMGCFNDSAGGMRALSDKWTSSSSMDISTCQAYCNGQGYRLSGVEYNTECHCSNVISNNANTNQTVDGFDQCTWLCSGTVARENGTQEICGGYAFVSIYNNTDPNFGKPATTTTSTSTSTSTVPSATSNTYLGCAPDNGSSRTLRGASTSGSTMTIEACAAFAQTGNNGAGYRYYGVEYSSECYVGNTLLAPGQMLSPTSCNMKCSGNSTETCGGSGALSVYTNSNYTANSTASATIGNYTAAGCLTDPSSSQGLRSLNATQYYYSGMTEDLCVSYCESKGYQYAGLEYGTQCYCGNNIVNQGQEVSCSNYELMACGGNIHQVCGSGGLMNLYYSPAK